MPTDELPNTSERPISEDASHKPADRDEAPRTVSEACPAHVNSTAGERAVREGAGQKRDRGEEEDGDTQQKRSKTEIWTEVPRIDRTESLRRKFETTFENMLLIYAPADRASELDGSNGESRKKLKVTHLEEALKQSYYSKGKETEVLKMVGKIAPEIAPSDQIDPKQFVERAWEYYDGGNTTQKHLIRELVDFFTVTEPSCSISNTSRNWWGRSQPYVLMTWAEIPIFNVLLYCMLPYFDGASCAKGNVTKNANQAENVPLIYIPTPYQCGDHRSSLRCYLIWLNCYAFIAIFGIIAFKLVTWDSPSVPEQLKTIRAVELYSPIVLYLILACMAIVKNKPGEELPQEWKVWKHEGRDGALFSKIQQMAKLRLGYMEGGSFEHAIPFSAFASLPLWWQIVCDVVQFSRTDSFLLDSCWLFPIVCTVILWRTSVVMGEYYRAEFQTNLESCHQTNKKDAANGGRCSSSNRLVTMDWIRWHVVILGLLLGRLGWCSHDRFVVYLFSIRLFCAHAFFSLMASFFCVAHGASSYFSFLLEENKVFLLLMSPRKLLKDLKMCSHLNHEVTSDEYFNLLTIEGIRKFSRVRKLLQKEHSTSNSKNYDVTLFMAGEEKKWEVIEKRCQEFKAHFERGDAIPRIMGIKIADNKNIISTVLCTSLFLTVIKSREQSGFPILGILDDLLPFDILTSAVGKLLGLDFG
ncbi:hypothetical protein CYMTET_30771 [Cymbomonas tetramitiformis]|uniref:Uncharacterized protein n=1 Tax=Cymbomonas tetramitiformis TaxID=36881 RepID=A0AAE0FIN0_9CHLO|nr:hypothetical protein CYMTET_30771 [Cymbomonas tetramitiformis]